MSGLTEACFTAAELSLLRTGCKGPRPGSNSWPFVFFECDAGSVEGERIDYFIRSGLLAPRPVDVVVLRPEADDLADFEIDCTHGYDVTPAGRAALASREDGPAQPHEGER